MPENQDLPDFQTPEISQGQTVDQKKPAEKKRPTIKGVVSLLAPASVPITAEITANNLLNSAEAGHEGRIHFEPGIHPITDMQSDILYAGYSDGQNVHAWNSEVGERISHYAPEVLAIDSLYPVIRERGEDEEKYRDRVEGNKLFVWLGIPDRVLKINPSGSVFVVSGDLGPSLGRKFSDGLGWDIYGKTAYPNEDVILPSMTEAYLKYILGYVIGSKILEQLNVVNKIPHTRRGFLGLMLKVIATTGIITVPGILSTVSPNNELESILRAINQSSTNIIRNNATDIVHGRTALLIEKEEDAIESLRSIGLIGENAQGSVIMGAAHDKYSYKFLNNRGLRLKAISRLAEVMLEVARTSAKEFGLSESQTNGTINSVLDFISTTQIWRATDSGEKFPVPDMDSYVRRNIEAPFHEFNSEGVEEAISHLRPS